jgi:hypothetical protein
MCREQHASYGLSGPDLAPMLRINGALLLLLYMKSWRALGQL